MMGKGIESWTDVDYAQAAIDMLPGTVEEIDAWMKNYRIKNNPGVHPRSAHCPIAQWIRRWTNTEVIHVGFSYVQVDGAEVRVPDHITRYIYAID